MGTDSGTGQDHRARPNPCAPANTNRLFNRPLAPNRNVDIVITMVLVSDVDVHSGKDVVGDIDTEMTHYRRAATNKTSLSYSHHGIADHVLAWSHPG